MKSNKITVAITIDKDIWELAKVLLPCNRSTFIERSIVQYINSIDDIEQLEKEIKQERQSLAIKEHKLQELKNIREKNTKNKEKINKAMETVFKIVLNNDEISETQIRDIANINFIDETILKEKVMKQGFRITKYTKEEHETTVKKLKLK